MPRRITIADRRDDDGFDVDIDGEMQFSITFEQAMRLKDALGRKTASGRSVGKTCRAAWSRIVRNNYQNIVPDVGRILFFQPTTEGDVQIKVTRSLCITPEDFINHLKESDRPRAIQFVEDNLER